MGIAFESGSTDAGCPNILSQNGMMIDFACSLPKLLGVPQSCMCCIVHTTLPVNTYCIRMHHRSRYSNILLLFLLLERSTDLKKDACMLCSVTYIYIHPNASPWLFAQHVFRLSMCDKDNAVSC